LASRIGDIRAVQYPHTPGEPSGPPYEIADQPDMAVNAALPAVGIHAERLADEFATVGLDRRRPSGQPGV
jgi:hypothetical protein